MRNLLLLIFCIPFLLRAQVQFDPLYNLSNTPSATSDYHSVFSDGMVYYTAWGDNGAVLLKKSTDFGYTWGTNNTVTPEGSYPVIAARGDDMVIIYHDLNTGVFVTKSSDGGSSWWLTPPIISTHSSAITPQLADGGTNLYAVWEERPASNYELYFSRSTNFGWNWSAPVNISNTSTTSRWVQVSANVNNIYCTWVETTTYPFSDIYFTKSTNAGATWSTPVNITNDSRPQNRIYMYVTSSGYIYLACDDITSYPIFNFDDIYLIKSTDGGGTWSTAVNITNNPGHSNTPCIAIVEPNIYFTWSDNTGSAPAYDNSDIYFKRSSDGGITWQDSIKICSNPETSSRPRLCWAWNGPLPTPWIELSVFWYDYSTGDAEILARKGKHTIPVELTSFTADAENNNVKIIWTTATETNNKGFDLQRREYLLDNWEQIVFVNGKGTTTEQQQYSYTDRNLQDGKYLYRLKQIDYDGSFSYSDEIEVNIGLPAEFSLSQNYPNPFNPATVIKYSLPADGYVSLKIYDMLGKEIAVLTDELKTAGRYEIEFNGSLLSSGIYFYRLSSGEYSTVKKMQLIK